MEHPTFPTELLRTFVAAVVEADGFRAAERPYKTQSTVSQQIQRPEEETARSCSNRTPRRFDHGGRTSPATPAGCSLICRKTRLWRPSPVRSLLTVTPGRQQQFVGRAAAHLCSQPRLRGPTPTSGVNVRYRLQYGSCGRIRNAANSMPCWRCWMSGRCPQRYRWESSQMVWIGADP